MPIRVVISLGGSIADGSARHIWMDMVIAANAQGFLGIERILYAVNPKIELLELPTSEWMPD